MSRLLGAHVGNLLGPLLGDDPDPKCQFRPPEWVMQNWGDVVAPFEVRAANADAIACAYCGVRSHDHTGNCRQCGAPR